MTYQEAVQQVFRDHPDAILTAPQLLAILRQMDPSRQWKRNTISCHLMGLSHNHTSRHHYAPLNPHSFLVYLGNGNYRVGDLESEDLGFEVEGESSLEPEVGDEEFELIPQPEWSSIALERDLEETLSNNLSGIELGLNLFQDGGRNGRQLDTGIVGRLDLLATDTEGSVVVIELKAGVADDRVCGQILRYMGWVKQEIAGERRVRGIIVANDFDTRLKYAVSAMPDVSLKKYEVQFRFSDVALS